MFGVEGRHRLGGGSEDSLPILAFYFIVPSTVHLLAYMGQPAFRRLVRVSYIGQEMDI